DLYLTTQCMLVILGQGGLAPGGVNFDAKVRRGSFAAGRPFPPPHPGKDGGGPRQENAAHRPASSAVLAVGQNTTSADDCEVGPQIEQGKASFASLEKYALEKGNAAANESGRQEMLENIINDYL